MGDDSYKTIRSAAKFEMKEKGSRFICRAAPVSDRAAAESFIVKISKQHFDATHNCFAYRVGIGPHTVTRFNDAGEPSGTAGKPILRAILGLDVTYIVVVVTRYFGGVKLGTGGLIRAYGGVTQGTLARAAVETKYIKDMFELTCTYQQLDSIMSLVNKFSGEVIDSNYTESIVCRVLLRQKYRESFVRLVVDQTAGHVRPLIVTQ